MGFVFLYRYDINSLCCAMQYSRCRSELQLTQSDSSCYKNIPYRTKWVGYPDICGFLERCMAELPSTVIWQTDHWHLESKFARLLNSFTPPSESLPEKLSALLLTFIFLLHTLSLIPIFRKETVTWAVARKGIVC